ALVDLTRDDLVERALAVLDLALEELLAPLHLAQHENAAHEREQRRAGGEDGVDCGHGHAVIGRARPRGRRRAGAPPTAVRAAAALTPIAHAPASDATAIATSTADGIRVRSGRPFSSSSACAAIPSARKNAISAQSSRSRWKCGASAAPTATYERCHSVYGG